MRMMLSTKLALVVLTMITGSNAAPKHKVHKARRSTGTGGSSCHAHDANSTTGGAGLEMNSTSLGNSSDLAADGGWDHHHAWNASQTISAIQSTDSTNPTTASSTTQSSETTQSASPTGESGGGGSTEGSPSGGSYPDDPLDMLALHNAYRPHYGASPVTWNSTIASYGNKYAEKCNFQHSGGPYGENLAAGTGSEYHIQQGFTSWTNENSSYNPQDPQYSHFTQVVWKSTTSIGCALVNCSDGTIFPKGYGTNVYIICEYYPPGNVIGEFPENVGTYQG